jgi:hypothetical protein
MGAEKWRSIFKDPSFQKNSKGMFIYYKKIWKRMLDVLNDDLNALQGTQN